MFCGTGKSRIITNVIIHGKKEVNVVVFPSLALISQYSTDYLQHPDYRRHFANTLNVSSLKEAEDTEICSGMKITTTPAEIKSFLGSNGSKVILVTYQSYSVLLDCLDGQKIGLVCYDEAHHVTSPGYQKLVFKTNYFEKEVFFTATPRNENGITMYDAAGEVDEVDEVDEVEFKSMCGPLAYDYTYLQGLNDEVLNQFELCVDMYTENKNASIYEAMARGILTRYTSRVLTFHSGVNGESNTSVWNFVNQAAFQNAFNQVVQNEFPERVGYYTRVTFEGMDGNTPAAVRKKLLAALDRTAENEIYIISSCETIGEGVDTKRANICVFADPKASVVKIIQNIGRVVRRNPAHPLSTVLIPCFVNMENYAAAEGDRVKQDELIREQMRSEKGDYTGILNVLAALRQEDPEIYDMCLNYPNRRAKETSLAKQGFSIIEPDEGYEGFTPEEVQIMKEQDALPLEIHTNDTIERYNEDSPEPLLRLYYDEENDRYKTIEPDEEEPDNRRILRPPTKAGVKMSVHQNADLQMLWGVTGALDFSKKFCSVVIACEVTFGVERWRSTHRLACAYMDEHKKPPSQHDKNPVIKKLGCWISAQKKNYAKNARIIASNPAIRKEWEATMEKYGEYLADANEQWRSTHRLVYGYMDEHQKAPSQQDKNPDVKKLATWICNQKSNYAKNENIMGSNPAIRKEWEATMEKYGEYFAYAEERWRSTHRLARAYFDNQQKRPYDSDIYPDDVRKLARWICTQKKTYAKNKCIMRSNPSIRKEWEATMEKYGEYLITDFDEQWRSTHRLARAYMDEHQKAPSRHDKNPVFNKLAKWISVQKINYAKNARIMGSNTEIRAEWETTLAKYGKYLKQTIIPAPALLPVAEVPPISEPIPVSPSERKRKSPSPEPAEPDQKRKLVPKKRKAYADLTEAERQRICEKVLRKRQEEKGYRSTNPDDKDTINRIFAGHISPAGPGKVVFLDHTEFKTAFALLEAGVKPEDMLIPQRADNFAAMARHELFGSSVILGEFNDVLNHYLSAGGVLKGVYADYCSTLEQDSLPFLALLEPFKPQVTPGAVLGVTITLRNPEGVRYAGQDIAIMEKRFYRQFPTGVNLFHQVGILASDDGPYTYGNGAPMATWLLKLNN